MAVKQNFKIFLLFTSENFWLKGNQNIYLNETHFSYTMKIIITTVKFLHVPERMHPFSCEVLS